MKKILILHGPNINLTGTREPDQYGNTPYDQMNEEMLDFPREQGVQCQVFQSNHEGTLIDLLHSAVGTFDGVVLNAGAYTHYSYAIRDAIAAIGLPVVEVHMSNVHKREEFRHQSVISPVCAGVICGFGKDSYRLGMLALLKLLEADK